MAAALAEAGADIISIQHTSHNEALAERIASTGRRFLPLTLDIGTETAAKEALDTDLNVALRANPERERQISERIPAGRWGTPEDMAGAVVFLASPASDYLHGHLLVVDGGWLAR